MYHLLYATAAPYQLIVVFALVAVSSASFEISSATTANPLPCSPARAASIEAFNAVAAGEMLTFFEAWKGALAYTFQLYFDFSGYSDMAIGLAMLFGIRLPLNFDSPYKARSIIEFWQRWHITLSRFLRDYLYIPLGGNRKGQVRRYLNLVITMLLGGLWHGAAWNFEYLPTSRVPLAGLCGGSL